MKVYLNTRGRSSGFTRQIKVTTNDPKHPQEVLTCKGQVKVAMSTTPSVANFGKVMRTDPPKQKTIEMTRGDGGPISPKLLGALPDGVKAEIREIEAGERYTLDVTVGSPWPNESIKGSLKIATGVRESPDTTIRVVASVPARVQTTPRQYTVPVERETEFEQAISVKWNEGGSFMVLSAVPSDARLQVDIESAESAQRVILHVPPEYTPEGRGPHFVTINTSDDQAPSLQVPIRFRNAQRPNARTANTAARVGRAASIQSEAPMEASPQTEAGDSKSKAHGRPMNQASNPAAVRGPARKVSTPPTRAIKAEKEPAPDATTDEGQE